MSVKTVVLRRVTRSAVGRYRRSSGRRGGTIKGLPLLLLTVRGRRTNTAHTVPLAYFADGEDTWLVTGSAGGMRAEPQWFRNLRVAGRAEVQVGDRTVPVTVEVTDGVERDRLWATIVEQAPFFARYEQKSGRTIPVARLRAVASDRPEAVGVATGHQS